MWGATVGRGYGEAIDVSPEIVEEVWSVTAITGGEGQCLEADAEPEAVSDPAISVDGAEGRESRSVVSQVVEQVRSEPAIARGEGKRPEANAGPKRSVTAPLVSMVPNVENPAASCRS